MTEVLFYHLQNMSLENVLPPLLEKSLERGWRIVVQSTSQERAEALDAHLWTYRDDFFLSHAARRNRRDRSTDARRAPRRAPARSTAPQSASRAPAIFRARAAERFPA